MERKTRNIGVGTTDALVLAVANDQAAAGASGVLDHRQTAASPDLDDCENVARHTHLVHAQDRLGAGGDGGLDQRRVDIARGRLYIDEYGLGAAVADAVRGGDVGMADG